jgi:hypothetical protein
LTQTIGYLDPCLTAMGAPLQDNGRRPPLSGAAPSYTLDQLLPQRFRPSDLLEDAGGATPLLLQAGTAPPADGRTD